jgi:hypothetical protein
LPVAAVVAAVTVTCAAPASAASAPNVTGMKYGEASASLNGAGFEPVVSTAVGDRTAWPNCLVTFQRQHNVPAPPNSKGKVRHQILVGLNCETAIATAKAPGPSTASTEGGAAKVATKKAG